MFIGKKINKNDNLGGLLFALLVGIFLIAGLTHPSEIKCLVPGFLYFLCLPSAFVFLNIYALINLNNMSWGTRETISAKQQTDDSKRLQNYFVNILPSELNKSKQKELSYSVDSLKKLETKVATITETTNIKNSSKPSRYNKNSKNKTNYLIAIEEFNHFKSWMQHDSLVNFEKKLVDKNEEKFYEKLIQKHLHTLKEDEEEVNKKRVTQDLNDLRNRCCFAFFMLNAAWIATLLSLNVLQANFKEKIYIYIADQRNEPVSFLFVAFFLIVILMQFVAMVWHRGITFIQLIRNAKPV